MKVMLINMPVSSLHVPSLALMQLRVLLEKRFDQRVQVEERYINHDFAKYIGTNLYRYLVYRFQESRLGEWLFRETAFPTSEDNAERYFNKFFSGNHETIVKFRNILLKKRKGMGEFLDTVIDEYCIDQADIVGFSSMFSQNNASFALARRLKEINPKITTVIGGANCEAPMGQEIIKYIEPIDFVFSGPGLISFPQFIQFAIDRDEEKQHAIDGVFSKKNVNTISPIETETNADRNGGEFYPLEVSWEKDLHTIKPLGAELDINTPIGLDYHPFLKSLKNNFQEKEVAPILLFETSRGCWWGEYAKCTFCGLNGNSIVYRSMNAESAIRQFNSLTSYYPDCTYFHSVDNILPKHYFKEVLPFVNLPSDVMIFSEVKSDVREEEFKALKSSNIGIIQPGVEALSTSVLKLMKKGSTSFQNIQLLKNCITYNIYPIWSIILGFPGEDESVYDKYYDDFPLLTHLPPPSQFMPMRIDRYSYYFDNAEQIGLEIQPDEFYKFIYPFEDDVVFNMAYYFVDTNENASYIQTMNKHMKNIEERFQSWRDRWYESADIPQPMLYIKKRGKPSSIIFDSRSQEVKEYSIDEIHVQLLEQLSKPARINHIYSKFNDVPNSILEQALAFLKVKGLVFEENDRYISLVFLHEPAPMFRPFAQTRFIDTSIFAE